jgi:hypothetical protein
LRSEYLHAERLAEIAWETASEAEFVKPGEAEYAADESQLVTETVYLATGLLLPIWGALPKEDLTVNRIVDKIGRFLARPPCPRSLRRRDPREARGQSQGADRSR